MNPITFFIVLLSEYFFGYFVFEMYFGYELALWCSLLLCGISFVLPFLTLKIIGLYEKEPQKGTRQFLMNGVTAVYGAASLILFALAVYILSNI